MLFRSFYGIAMASLGMLSVTPCILTLHIFSPISSTTEKLVKLSKSKQGTLKTISKSEVIGQTTVAIGNGFASGASAFSTLSLILITLLITQSKFNTLLLIDLKWVIGLMIGLMLPFVFSGFLLRKLSQLIVASIQETVRQFKEIPFLKENKAHPDIIKATDEHARFCMDALIIPSIIMAFTPILVGYLFGLKLLIGLIFGAFLTGLNQSYYWANLGESSENAKRYIEKGFLGGKNSANFKEILTTSNIGSAFKDLLSPSLNIFIKSVAIIGLLVIIFLNQHLF